MRCTLTTLLVFFCFYFSSDYLLGVRHDINSACAVVTGSSSGIGINIAESLLREGTSQIILAARRIDALEAVMKVLKEKYPQSEIFTLKTDVTSLEDRSNLLSLAKDKFHRHCRIILVNNAGMEYWHPFETMTKSKMEQHISVNLLALMHITHDFLPSMLASKNRGHIMNIASHAGHYNVPFGAAYAASKHGVIGFTKAIRSEFRDRGIQASAISPGYISNSGMYSEMTERLKKEKLLDNVDEMMMWNDILVGFSQPQDSAEAVIKALKYDIPHLYVNSHPDVLHITLANIFPRYFDIVYAVLDKPIEFIRTLAYLREKETLATKLAKQTPG